MASPMLTRLALRRSGPRQLTNTSRWVRHASDNSHKTTPNARFPRKYIVAVLGVSGAALAAAPYVIDHFVRTEAPVEPEKPKLVFEKPLRKSASAEENRDTLSPQHLQVKNAWEHPGVYAWGSNVGRVVDPESDEPVVKTPKRLRWFDGQLLRDLKLDQNFGAAITEKGDLVQWGAAFDKTATSPVPTLQGKDLVKISLSRDRIIALSRDGSVYSVPVSSQQQKAGEKPSESSWVPFWSGRSSVSYLPLAPAGLGWGEKVVDVKSGLEHCLLLTSKGRVFSAAASSESFPSHGQLGVPGLTWQTRPKGPFYQPHEVQALSDHTVKSIAAGDFHSLALDNNGQIYAFGDNSYGQLGSETLLGRPFVDNPSPVRVDKLYRGSGLAPKVTSIAAGGLNSFFTVDATPVPALDGTKAGQGRTVADTWACGEGIKGSLGNGKWTHISGVPTKIKALSDLSEYSEKTNSVVPIRIAQVVAGGAHACAVLDNATNVSAGQSKSSSDTNFGRDVMWWGGNEFHQLGTGKRSNLNTPTYIAPLDGEAVGESSRFQLTPRRTGRIGEGGSGRKVSMEQKVELGRQVTAVYSST
ncbi:regulator of chromosome condensation 1/beta-lactamase-inhibitor protein II [Podospora conica]|nr:regulator of chromosome condensation 1/beta-lactamase-inhibitor protein II [Schizothecium conicum]